MDRVVICGIEQNYRMYDNSDIEDGMAPNNYWNNGYCKDCALVYASSNGSCDTCGGNKMTFEEIMTSLLS